MVIRKPYAFLIKNFKKIHIFLLILCGFIYYKHMQTSSFVNDFLNFGVYNPELESIMAYTSVYSYIALAFIIISTLILIILLIYKGKPWKLYLVIFFEYIFMLVTFGMTTNFFINFEGSTATIGVRVIDNLLSIASLPQYAVMIILFIRIFGIDLNKFSFNTDEEYLELSSEDREEFEINVTIDKNSFKRTWNKLKRNLNYFYEEHKFICNSIVVIVFIGGISYSYYYFGILHKTYEENEHFQANSYDIVVNKAYYTDKDYNGDLINKYGYVAVDINVTNLYSTREIDINKFHLGSGKSYSTVTTQYNEYFKDLGKPYTLTELQKDKSYNFLLIFKVDKEIMSDKFVLYYQEVHSQYESYLRKVKLNIEYLSSIEKQDTKKLTEKLVMETVDNKKKNVTINTYEITDSAAYTYYSCPIDGCYIKDGILNSTTNNKILKLQFSSSSFEGKDFIDFLMRYGKIKYVDSKNETVEIEVKNYLTKNYTGKEAFIKVPQELDTSSKIDIHFVVRNKEYVYTLR